MPSDDEIHRLRTEVSGDEEIETTFRRLRQDGRSRLEALRVILDVLDVSLAEAKTLLLTNETWEEARSATEQEAEGTKGGGEAGFDDSVPPAPG
jgi:hypothetical protein